MVEEFYRSRTSAAGDEEEEGDTPVPRPAALFSEGTRHDALMVLVVDDNPTNISVLMDYLESEGFEVSAAESGESALEMLDFFVPDIILLDVMMPGMDGYTVCKRLKSREKTRDIPVIFMTALSDITNKVRGFEVGAVDYVTKPFQQEEVLVRINTHTTIHHLQQQLQTANQSLAEMNSMLEQRVARRTAELATVNANLQKTNRVYSRFVPKDLLNLLHKDTITNVTLGDHIAMDMTIMFADIRGFTTVTEEMTPVESFAFINKYFQHVSPLIREHHGFIDKFIGDAIMALFPTNVDDALSAAIAMQSSLEEYNRQRRSANNFPIEIGIGLHTGHVMLGIVGEQERFEGTVISDAVNLASRLEGLTKLYGAPIIISEQTLHASKNENQYRRRFLETVKVIGKKDPVSVFEILDGNPEEIVSLKLKTQADFEQGLTMYRQQKFAEASAHFTKILKINPNDQAARLYLKKTTNFMTNGVPDGWTGVEVLMTK
jgi:class 3 adenylate cyclase/AmiR/NasT family two-component response regulator